MSSPASVDASWVGRQASVTYELDAAKVRRFARAVGETDPRYLGEDQARRARAGRLLAPPAAAAMLILPPLYKLLEEAAGSQPSLAILHREQEFEFHRPLLAQQAFDVRATVSRAFARAGNGVLYVEYEVMDRAGARTVSGRSNLLLRPASSGEGEEAPSPGSSSALSSSPAAAQPPGEEAGQAASPSPWPRLHVVVDRGMIARYAEASGDFNPIHLDDQAARARGLPGVVAHGLLSLALFARMLTGWAGDPSALRRLKARFTGFVRPGDHLLLTAAPRLAPATGGEPLQPRQAAAGGVLFDGRGLNQHGQEVLSRAEAVLHRDG